MNPILKHMGRLILVIFCSWSIIIVPIGNTRVLAQGSPAEAVRPRVAVLDFQGSGISKAEATAVADQMRNDLVNLRVFTVLDRAQTEQVLNELAFQQGGMTDPGKAAEIGKMLNVEFIVTGRVTSLQGAYQVNSQMINVQSTEIVRSESILYKGALIGLLSQNIATMAAKLAQVEAQQPTQQTQPGVEGEGLSWWVWALIGVGVVGVAAALSGSDSGGGGESGGGSSCPSGAGNCGSVEVTW